MVSAAIGHCLQHTRSLQCLKVQVLTALTQIYALTKKGEIV